MHRRRPRGLRRREQASQVREIADDVLVERSRRGDPRALAELYRRHAPTLLGYLTRLSGEPSEAGMTRVARHGRCSLTSTCHSAS